MAAIAIAVSCAKITPDELTQEVSFNPVAGKVSTKASVGPISGTTYKTTDTFGAFAYKVTSGAQATNATNELYIPESQISYQNNEWKASTPYYWPSDGSSLTFYAYSPYAIEESVACDAAKGVQINDYDVSANQNYDVMVADVNTPTTKAAVATTFRHKLAYVADVQFKTAANYRLGDNTIGDKKITVTGVKFTGLKYVGSYNQNASSAEEGEAWTPTDATKEEVWTSASTLLTDVANSLEGKKSHLFVLPQAFTNDVKMVINYTVETYNGSAYVKETLSKALVLNTTAHTNWSMNKKYTYNVTVGLEEITWSPSIVEWDSVTPAGYSF